MKTIITAAVLLLIPSLGTSKGSAGQQVEPMAAKWEIDLRAAIGGVPLGVVVGRGHETQGKPRTSLWFVDNETIVTSFVTREGRASLSSRDDSNTSLPLRLRVLILDAKTGHIQATRTWPTNSRVAGIVAAHDGQFVAQTGNVLTSYSSALNELKKLKLPDIDIGLNSYSSPSGKTILFVATDLQTKAAVRWILVDARDLKIVHSWDEVQSGWVGISDSEIAMTNCVWLYSCEPRIEVRSLNTKWKVVASASRHNAPPPHFVTEDQLFLLGNPAKLIATNGTIIFAEEMSGRCSWGGVYPSSVDQRFAVPTCKLTGNVKSLDLSGREELENILLHDPPFHGVSRTLDISGQKVIGLSLLALSPDGSKLALMNGQSLRVFDLHQPTQ